MTTKSSSYNVKLGYFFLLRAQSIFLILILLVLGAAGTGVYLGVKDGTFQKKIDSIKHNFQASFENFMAESTHSASVDTDYGQNIQININNDDSDIPTPTPMPVVTKKPTVQKPYVAPQSTCKYYNIREGQFASNKCYTTDDYNDLVYYLNRYDSVVFDKQGAEGQASVTCSGFSDNFKQQCEKNKAQIAKDDQDIAKYTGIINSIIARGK